MTTHTATVQYLSTATASTVPWTTNAYTIGGTANGTLQFVAMGPTGTTTLPSAFGGALWPTLDNRDAVSARRPPPREFNRYINASDLIEEFIAWLGTQRVRQREVMGLPLELFIKWLIIRACEQDQEEPPVELVLPAPAPRPRCVGCGRFVTARTRVRLCSTTCAQRHFGRQHRQGPPRLTVQSA